MIKTKKSDTKARRYYNEKKVFPVLNTAHYELYAVEGDTGVWNIRFDKLKNDYSCTCPNIKMVNCSHIKAVLRYKKYDEKRI